MGHSPAEAEHRPESDRLANGAGELNRAAIRRDGRLDLDARPLGVAGEVGLDGGLNPLQRQRSDLGLHLFAEHVGCQQHDHIDRQSVILTGIT